MAGQINTGGIHRLEPDSTGPKHAPGAWAPKRTGAS